MTRMISIFVGIGLGLAASGAAFAADMPVKAPAMVAAPPSWTGLYLGINGGVAWSTVDTSLRIANGPIGFFFPPNIPGVAQAGSLNFSSSKGIFGGQIGYLVQSGQLIAGAEVGVDWRKLSSSATVSQLYLSAFPNQGFTINKGISSDWLVTALARLGVDMGSWYPYATAGAAVTNFDSSFTYIDTVFAPGCACASSFNKTVFGPAIGAGLEVRFAEHWLLRGEFLFIEFNNEGIGTSVLVQPVAVPGEAAGASAMFMHSAIFKESIARGFLSYKF